MLSKQRHVELKKQDYNDVIYFDATIYNNNTEAGQQRSQIASFDTTLVGPLLNDPSEYYMAIARFSISHMEIPLYFFQIGFYSVSISDDAGATWNQQFLNYEILNSVQSKTSFGFEAGSLPVYYYEQIVTMVNNALEAAHVALAIAGPAPFITYNERETDRFTFYFPLEYIVDNNILIAFNSNLYQQFQFFKAFNNIYNDPNGADYVLQKIQMNAQLNRYENPLTNDPYFYYVQERPALYLFNEIQNLVFTSNKIPINREYLELSTRQNGRPISLPILADFVPDLSKGRDLSEYQFYPQGPYRLIDLTSDTPFNSLDIQISFVTRSGEVFPLYLEPGEVATVKLAFFKKDSNSWA